jgi:nitroreductase
MEYIKEYRKPEFPISEIILSRWSPRAMSGEEVTKEELMPLFEAAKWAPSSYNNQPWRFIYALKNTVEWDTLFNLLVEFNQSWVKNAGAIILVVSKKNFEHNNKFSRTHKFDTGLAVENLLLQANLNGLVAHGMQGFDYDKAREDLVLSEDYDVECMVAVGKAGEKENLPKEMQENEFPSDRKKLSEIAFEGKLY